jgi:uncharacterized protein
LPRANEPSERTCVVTRRTEPVARLIRFVMAPDGSVVPDLRRRLPGRGVWITAKADYVRTAERRRLFARGFGVPVKIEPDLAERVGVRLREAALSALSLARKAGTVVTGFSKVEGALAAGPVVALVNAAEARPDGVAKLAAAAGRRFGEKSDLAVIGLFTGEELDLAFGRANVIHAALLAGPASANVLARVNALADYLGEAARPDGDQCLVRDDSDVSPGLKSA